MLPPAVPPPASEATLVSKPVMSSAAPAALVSVTDGAAPKAEAPFTLSVPRLMVVAPE